MHCLIQAQHASPCALQLHYAATDHQAVARNNGSSSSNSSGSSKNGGAAVVM
jgi:hypothetical protein